MKKIWDKHKGAIIASTLAACIGSLLTLGAGVYNLTRSFKYQRAHEILNSTRLAIGFLQNIQTEMDANSNLMLNHNYKATMQFSAPYNQAEMMTALIEAAMNSATNASVSEKQGMSNYVAYMKKMMGDVVKVEKFDCPEEILSTAVWDHGAPEIADIDYDLLRELTQYYLAVHRLDGSIVALNTMQVTPGSSIAPEYAEKLRKMVVVHNDNVARLVERSVDDLKHKIQKEMERLHDLRKKFEDSF